MITSQLHQLVGSITIQARVPDMRNGQHVVEPAHHHQGRAHAVEVPVAVRHREDSLIGFDRGHSQSRERLGDRLDVGIFQRVAHALHRHCRGHIAALVASHAVGKHSPLLVLVEQAGILVALTHATDISAGSHQQGIDRLIRDHGHSYNFV